MTHHHHIVAYYLRLAQLAREHFDVVAEQYYCGRAFLYSDW